MISFRCLPVISAIVVLLSFCARSSDAAASNDTLTVCHKLSTNEFCVTDNVNATNTTINGEYFRPFSDFVLSGENVSSVVQISNEACTTCHVCPSFNLSVSVELYTNAKCHVHIANDNCTSCEYCRNRETTLINNSTFTANYTYANSSNITCRALNVYDPPQVNGTSAAFSSPPRWTMASLLAGMVVYIMI
jgi:hypothetical protein